MYQAGFTSGKDFRIVPCYSESWVNPRASEPNNLTCVSTLDGISGTKCCFKQGASMNFAIRTCRRPDSHLKKLSCRPGFMVREVFVTSVPKSCLLHRLNHVVIFNFRIPHILLALITISQPKEHPFWRDFHRSPRGIAQVTRKGITT